jgi:hypothetical protein
MHNLIFLWSPKKKADWSYWLSLKRPTSATSPHLSSKQDAGQITDGAADCEPRNPGTQQALPYAEYTPPEFKRFVD